MVRGLFVVGLSAGWVVVCRSAIARCAVGGRIVGRRRDAGKIVCHWRTWERESASRADLCGITVSIYVPVGKPPSTLFWVGDLSRSPRLP